MDELLDEALPWIEKLKDRDEQALAELFSLYRDRLWQLVHFRIDRRLAGRVDADDVLQEVYLAAAERVHHYVENPRGSFYVWLRLVALQTLVDVHRTHIGAEKRSAARERSIGGYDPKATAVSMADVLIGQMTTPSHAAWRAELSEKLEQFVEDMDPIDREVLALRHFEELTNGEVAEVLGIEVKAASIRYVRALKRLRKVMAEIPGFSEEELL